MADFLSRLAGRTMGLAPTVQPIIAPMYAPRPVVAGNQAAPVVLDDETSSDLDGRHRVSSPHGRDTQQGLSEQEHQVEAGHPQRISLPDASVDQDKERQKYRTLGPPTDEGQGVVGARRIAPIVPFFLHRGRDSSRPYGQSEHLSSAQDPFLDAYGHTQGIPLQVDTLPKLDTPASRSEPPMGASPDQSSTLPVEATSVPVEPRTFRTSVEQRHTRYAMELHRSATDSYSHSPQHQDVPEMQSASTPTQRPALLGAARPQVNVHNVHNVHMEHMGSPPVDQHETVLESPSTGPTIQVTIGRIEVRATPPPTPRPQTQRSAPSVMSLDDYLNQRARGGH